MTQAMNIIRLAHLCPAIRNLTQCCMWCKNYIYSIHKVEWIIRWSRYNGGKGRPNIFESWMNEKKLSRDASSFSLHSGLFHVLTWPLLSQFVYNDLRYLSQFTSLQFLTWLLSATHMNNRSKGWRHFFGLVKNRRFSLHEGSRFTYLTYVQNCLNGRTGFEIKAQKTRHVCFHSWSPEWMIKSCFKYT
jgi:hypothetical protein